MNHHTLTATFAAPRDEVFSYLADIERLPEWATDFARELKLVDGRYRVVNGFGEFFFEIRADPSSGVIDMLAGPSEDALALFPSRVVRVLEGLPVNVLGVEASGRVTDGGYEAVLVPAVREKRTAHDRLRFLNVLGDD